MYLIRNADVYAPEHLGKQDILICNDKIAAVAPSLEPNLPGIKVIDAQGKTAVPGFIDKHVHLTGGGGEGGLHTRTPEFPFSTAVKAGVTTLVGVLGTDSFTRSVENLVAKTKALKNEGLTAYCLTGAYQYPSITLTGSVAKDIVFIEEVIGCKLAMSDHRCSHPTEEEVLRLVSDIRMASLVAGKPGELHIHIGGTGNCIQMLFDLVEHTDVPIWHLRPTHMGRHPEDAIRFTQLGGYADITAKVDSHIQLKDLIKEAAPGMLTLSSDSNGSLPVWNEKHENIGVKVASIQTLYDTIRNMVVLENVPLEEALPLVTTNVARALRLYPVKGTITPGCDGDLLLLDQDLKVDTVFARGKMMMESSQLLVKGMFEA